MSMRALVKFVFFETLMLRTAKLSYPKQVFTRSTEVDGQPDGDETSSKSNTDHLKHPFEQLSCYAKLYHYFSFLGTIILSMKYGFMQICDLGYLKQYHYLSCIFMGRYVLHSRSNDTIVYLAQYTALQNLRWLVDVLYYQNGFCFDCHEFLMIDREKLIYYERKFSNQNRHHFYKWPHQRNNSFMQREKMSKQEAELTKIFFIESSYNPQHQPQQQQQQGEIKYYRRCNRTVKSWDFLAYRLIRSIKMLFVFLIFFALPVVYVQLPMFITERGFEITYKHCILSLLDYRLQSEDQSEAFSYIYPIKEANYTLSSKMPMDILMPLENFVQFNWYQVIRVSIDFIESVCLALQSIIVMVLIQIICVLMGDDIFHYARYIEKSFKRLLSLIEESNLFDECCQEAKFINCKTKLRMRQIDEETLKLQVMVEDLLKLIIQYNKTINAISWRYLFVWVSYTALTVHWLSLGIGQLKVSTFETIIIQSFFAFCCLPMIQSFASVRKQSQLLYKQMATCVALDNCNSGEHLEPKSRRLKRWTQLMQIYYPKPLNSFTIKGRGISWLSTLKFVAWFLSVLFVLSTFRLYSYKVNNDLTI